MSGYVPKNRKEFQQRLARKAGALYIIISKNNFDEFVRKLKEGNYVND